MREKRILLAVDDEPYILQSIEDLFEDDFKLLLSRDAEEALRMLESNEVAVILSDQRMPGLGGDMFLAKAREVSTATRLLISGYADMEALVRAVNNGNIYAYTAKPWNPVHLKQLISMAADHYDLGRAMDQERTLLNTLMESIPDAIYFKDRQSCFTRINQAQARFLGLKDPAESIGKRDSDYLPTDYSRSAYADEQRIVQSGRPLVDKVEEVKKANSISRWISTAKVAIHDKNGGAVTGIAGISRDITDLKRTELALRASDERFRQLASNIDDVFWIINVQFTETVYISPAYEKIWGRTCASLYAEPMSWADAIHPEDRSRVVGALERLAHGDFNEEYRILRPDGSMCWISSRGFPVEDEAGTVYRLAGVNQDITQRKRDQEAVHRAQLAAEAANRAKSDFLARMSHEIRSPMNAICGMTELLLETPLDDNQREYLRIFRNNSEHLLTLINDILDLSKVESGRFELENVAFDLMEVLDRAVDLFTAAAREKHLELTYRINEDVPIAFSGDVDRLQQILVNLIGNAVKFTKQGKVTVLVKRDSEHDSPGALRFHVSDSGPGIRNEQLQTIFEPFVQGDSSVTRRTGGTGLGLAICKKFTELMGGSIWVSSEVGRGCTFTFTAVLEVRSVSQIAQSSELAGLSGVRALVVDDQPTNRLLLRRLLEPLGVQVDEVPDGSEAIRKLLAEASQGLHYDVILLDRNMPELDGFDVAAQIRDNASFASPVVLMLISDLQYGDLARAREVGIKATLEKPIKRSRLSSTLKEALSVSRIKKPVAGGQSVEHPKAPASKARILIAEDSEDNRFLATKFLESQNYEFDFAENGVVAVDKQRARPYDLILMDVQMPEKDGYTATKEIRSWEVENCMARVPIVALTAHALKGEEMRSREAGCTAFLSKPIQKAKLINEIERHLNPAAPLRKPESEPKRNAGIMARVPIYLARRRDDVRTIETLLSQGDFDKIRVLAHNMKGSGTGYGFPEITKFGASIERAAKSSDKAAVSEQTASLDALVSTLHQAAVPKT